MLLECGRSIVKISVIQASPKVTSLLLFQQNLTAIAIM